MNNLLTDRSYRFSINIIKFLKVLPNEYIYNTIGKQLLRSGTSIGANIVETQASGSKKMFAQYYSIALNSANETKYWLNLILEFLDKNLYDVEILIKESSEIANILGASLITLRRNLKSKT